MQVAFLLVFQAYIVSNYDIARTRIVTEPNPEGIIFSFAIQFIIDPINEKFLHVHFLSDSKADELKLYP